MKKKVILSPEERRLGIKSLETAILIYLILLKPFLKGDFIV
jgi:hypothetical protein